jgi:hypothetical protein
VRGGHHAAGTVAEQHRQAVGGEHGAHLPLLAGERRVGFQVRIAPELDHPRAVNLPEPARLGRQLLAQARAVGRDAGRVVADMVAKIEAGPGRLA